jgi:hypothetical protein
MADDIPFAATRKISVVPEPDNDGRANVFLEDALAAILATSPERAYRAAEAILLAINVVGRPKDSLSETLPRDALLAIEKAIARSTPTEQLTILGWDIDTRRVQISLPDDKFREWMRTIHELLEGPPGKWVPHSLLETLVGRLNHTAAIVQPTRHCLSCLPAAELMAAKHKGTRLTTQARLDLLAWKLYLTVAHEGIDMNLLVERDPDHITRTDACEYGIGAFTWIRG